MLVFLLLLFLGIPVFFYWKNKRGSSADIKAEIEGLRRFEEERRNEKIALREQMPGLYNTILAKFKDANDLYDTDYMSAMSIAKSAWDKYLQYNANINQLMSYGMYINKKALPAELLTKWASRVVNASQIGDWKCLAIEAHHCAPSCNYNYLNKNKEELALKSKSYRDVCKALEWYVGANGDLCLCEDLMRFLCDAYALDIKPTEDNCNLNGFEACSNRDIYAYVFYNYYYGDSNEELELDDDYYVDNCPEGEGLDGLAKYWKLTIDKAIEYKIGDFQEAIEELLDKVNEGLKSEILDYLKQYKTQDSWAAELLESYQY